MELLDRYLFAVGRYLPKERRDDILAEMRVNILALVEDREQDLGRPLNLEEEEAVLKQHGHPMLVAARYLPQQHLIGPTVFPFYWHVMKVAAPWVALLYIIGRSTQFITQSVTPERIADIAFGFIPVAFYAAAWITLVFALMEYGTSRYMKNPKVLYAWKPRNLPAPEPAELERRTHPIVDFIGSLVTLVFLIIVRQHPFFVLGPGVFYLNMLRPAPIWTTVYTIAIVFVSIQLMAKLMVIFSPTVRGWRIAIDLLTKASAVGIIGFLLRTREYVVLGPAPDAAKLQKTVDSLNYAMFIGWKVVFIVVIVQLLWQVAKLVFPRLQLHVRPSHFIS